MQSGGNLGVESSQASLCPSFRSTCTTAESHRHKHRHKHKHTQTQTQTQTQVGSHGALRPLRSTCISLPMQKSSTLLCYISLFSRYYLVGQLTSNSQEPRDFFYSMYFSPFRHLSRLSGYPDSGVDIDIEIGTATLRTLKILWLKLRKVINNIQPILLTSWTEFLFSTAKNININNLTKQHTSSHCNLFVATSFRCEFKPFSQIIYKHTIKIFSSVGAWFSKGFKQRSAIYDISEIFEIKIYWISRDLRNPSIDIFEIMLITSHDIMLTHKLYSWIMRDGVK